MDLELRTKAMYFTFERTESERGKRPLAPPLSRNRYKLNSFHLYWPHSQDIQLVPVPWVLLNQNMPCFTTSPKPGHYNEHNSQNAGEHQMAGGGEGFCALARL